MTVHEHWAAKTKAPDTRLHCGNADQEICEILGMKGRHVESIALVISATEMTKVHVTELITNSQMTEIKKVLQKYKLVKV